ncbi:MAG TPA: hypothetical protein VLM17_03295 [Xanthomonadaceae bacterium]|nr:hypothetical protein [Xanthomonadaceae bacterium]
MSATRPLSPELEADLDALEQAMPQLQLQQPGGMFAFAGAWAERHDALLARTPPAERGEMQARLRRIGIRWGLVEGARMTLQFPALPLLRRRVG